jgi:peptidyl-prolyl cis-trans isomerase SurA
VREQILLLRLREREVDDKVQVSESEIDALLEETKAQSGGRIAYNAAHILVRLPEQASPERIDAARAKAAQAQAEARSGADFGRLAAAYSDAGDALQGGAIGWRTADRMPELFAGALAGMKPGEVSEVLRSSAGFHVLKLIDQRGEGAQSAPTTQTRLRHILIRPSEAVSENEARRRLADLRERIVNGKADFGELARVHSDDGSAARGGELDWVYPGDTVPDFERAYQELKPGEVSPPVRTPFGYHLIQVIERRTGEASPERRRMQARQALRERKAEEAYQEWLRQLRDQTYVEMRLEER